jgi:hyperosmotically inducible protein
MIRRMNPKLLALASGTVVLAVLMSGCERQQPVPPGSTVTPAASVGTQIDDTLVTTKVKAALVGDKEINGLGIKVETRKGVVQLSGFADNQAQVDRAITIARGIEGVTNIENGVSIRQGKASVGNTVDDGILTGKVKSALIQDPSVKALDIAVATSKGQVQLSGFVDNQAQIDQAIQVAKSVEGVTNVDNKMSVKK